ncbi:helix-turn-helix transcriptional regulator [Hyalangium sp.]|uniref:helix-turn-helix transcriptional regulator n=1 Tax=Hyalangium sp. TaxID=2028555 RepID=UPI002D3F7FEA|nr:helix-turn-helix transcriptional regulator [Hyalangium sp.]HYH95716.1 helix-turn-helix transcriptional regulator [Hyalangium sp.]
MDGLDKRKLGRNIRQARCRLGLTQEQMAERIDMAPEVYGRLERGHLVPRLERFVAICRVLGESPDRLIFPPVGTEAEGEAPAPQGGTSMDTLTVALAANVREARKEIGLTQAEMAARVRLSVDAYGRIERGVMLPDLEAFVAICRVLGGMSDRLLGLKPRRRKKRR